MASKSGNKSKDFEQDWKDRFPNAPVPRLTCFEENEESASNDKQAYRKSLQVSLDFHSLRISELQKKLQQQQFILEYIAKELESLPVPRQASISLLNSTLKPTPLPRKAPAIAKKPSKSSTSSETSSSGVIRRNHSTPSPRKTPTEKRFQFSSVFVPNSESIEEVSPGWEQPKSSKKNDASIEGESDPIDDRFHAFQGRTFSSSSRTESTERPVGSSTNAFSNPAAGSPAIIENRVTHDYEPVQVAPAPPPKVNRNSMKRLDRISIQDTESSSGNSSPDTASNDYMQLWNTEPLVDIKRTPSSVSSEVR